MHRSSFKVFAFVVILTLLTTSVAFAKPEGPEGPKGPIGPASTYMQGATYQTGSPTVPPQGAGLNDGKVHAQSIALGKPGTAFRYNGTFGTTDTAYYDYDPLTHPTLYLNGPIGVTVDADGNVYAVEESGARLLKWNSAGVLQWKSGIAGLRDWGQTGLSLPREVAVGPDGKIWVTNPDVVARFEPADGTLIPNSIFPSTPWNTPDETRFGELRGIAFDHAGHLYLADMRRQRVQVFTLGAGDPQYLATVGMTDNWGNGANQFNQPTQIAVDSHNNLYVADLQNFRVQACAPSADFLTWTCTTLNGGQQGFEDGQLFFAFGLGIDGADNLYIVDSGGLRIKKCANVSVTMTCDEHFITGLNWAFDAAAAPDGSIMVAGMGDSTLLKYNADGTFNTIFAGVTGIPYQTTDRLYNSPRALEVNTAGNIYLGEEYGQRLVKLSAAGAPLWVRGVAGKGDADASHINSPQALAVNPTRTMLAVAGGGSNVRLYNPTTGSYIKNIDQGWGDGPYQFKQASGVAFDPLGTFYVADRENQRVIKFSALGVRMSQLGVTGERGPQNDHFNNPAGLAVDALGNLYVADHDNCRVQKYNRAGLFLMTIGTARCGWEIDRMGGPADVAVDNLRRVYVSEEWNNRVTVFDPNGAYLTTLGGAWGTQTGRLRNPAAVAVDTRGNVFVADPISARVQKYTLSVPFAAQMTLNAFGDRNWNTVTSLAMFKNQLYAGTNDWRGGSIWRKGVYGWEKVVTEGFEDGANKGIDHMLVFNNYLYASTWNCWGDGCSNTNGGQLYRSLDGMTWQPVTTDGFGNQTNGEIFRLAVLNKKLCASTWSYGGQGSELWCSATGDPATWTMEAAPGFGDPNNEFIPSMIEYGGAQFAGTRNITSGANIYRRVGIGPWSPVGATLRNAGAGVVEAFAVYKTYLYATTSNPGGIQVWRCKLCDGSDWFQVKANGFGDSNNWGTMGAMAATPLGLYVVTHNQTTGLQIWKSVDGLAFSKLTADGLGSSNNGATYWNNALIVSGYNLYLGSYNEVNGGAVWKICSASLCI